MQEDEIDWYGIVKDLSLYEDDAPLPDDLEIVGVFIQQVAISKLLMNLEAQLDLIASNLDWYNV